MTTTGWSPTAMPAPETQFTPLIPDFTQMVLESSAAGERQAEVDGER